MNMATSSQVTRKGYHYLGAHVEVKEFSSVKWNLKLDENRGETRGCGLILLPWLTDPKFMLSLSFLNSRKGEGICEDSLVVSGLVCGCHSPRSLCTVCWTPDGGQTPEFPKSY